MLLASLCSVFLFILGDKASPTVDTEERRNRLRQQRFFLGHEYITKGQFNLTGDIVGCITKDVLVFTIPADRNK